MATTVVERRCVVGASADRVWQRVVTPEGINDEMRPWLTMAMPRGVRALFGHRHRRLRHHFG